MMRRERLKELARALDAVGDSSRLVGLEQD